MAASAEPPVCRGRTRALAFAAGGLVIVLVALIGWRTFGGHTDEPDSRRASATTSDDPSAEGPSAEEPSAEEPPDAAPQPDDPRLDAALSTPTEDSVYPRIGDPGVDALHYGLTLTWKRDEQTLEGRERLVLRAATTADKLRLDLAEQLAVSEVSVDGAPAAFQHTGKDLVIKTPVTRDQRLVIEVEYAGTPEPVEAPVSRSDFSKIGWQTNDDGTTWTMQEPFGAFTWFAVNDQPSDKALYDFTLISDNHLVGVANGELVDASVRGDTTTHRWHLADPASSYLTTVAFDDFVRTDGRSAGGVPITWWIPSDEQTMLKDYQEIVGLMAWAEERLGPYPWPTLGVMMVDSDSAMETQSMLTLGDSDYIRSKPVILHELVHQWFGDLVTPSDWSDVWLNEGITTYVEARYAAESENNAGRPRIKDWKSFDSALRREAGPPGDYDPEEFGSGNVYFSAGLMWSEIHDLVGEEAFWEMLRAWTQEHARGNVTRDDLFALIEERAETAPEGGWDAFFDAWIMGRTSPVSR